MRCLLTLATQAGTGPERLEKLRAAKAEKCGGFANRIVWLGNRQGARLGLEDC
jgi:hypothetical protein